MIVDDAVVMRRLMRQYLNDMGFSQIVEAVDGRDALEKLSSGGADLIISDWLMPNLDGLGLLKAARENEAWGKIPFLMVTLLDQKEKVMEAVGEGVNDYIVKPLNYDNFRQKVGKLLGETV